MQNPTFCFTLQHTELRLHERAVLLQYFKPLTETVNSDDVVPKLIQRSILSHEEKNRINLAPRNSDRMKLIIEMIPKKATSKAFDKFCDVIKYKYTSLYDQLVKAKQAPFIQEKPGTTVPYTNTGGCDSAKDICHCKFYYAVWKI